MTVPESSIAVVLTWTVIDNYARRPPAAAPVTTAAKEPQSLALLHPLRTRLQFKSALPIVNIRTALE